MFKKNSARGGALNRLDKNYPKLIHKSGYKLFLCFLTLIFILSTAFVLLPHTQSISPDLITDDAFTSDDTTSYVTVGEIWNGTKFDLDNLNKLIKYCSGDNNASTTSLSSISSKVTTQAGITASTMRSSTAGGKTSGKDIVVRMAGLDWTPTYLSKDKSGNLILTLWLTNNEQDAWQTRTGHEDEGMAHGFMKAKETGKIGLYSSMNTYDSEITYYIPQYPANMYGTSYIRAATLNNGGYYATSEDSMSGYADQDLNSVFAKFTMNNVSGSVSKYIVAPSQITWQEYGQNNSTKSLLNENWSPNIPDYGEYQGEYYDFCATNSTDFYCNYASISGNSDWKDDKLWIPSFSETGSYGSYSGLWQLSDNQFKNGDGSSSDSYSSWLRSGTVALTSWNPYETYQEFNLVLSNKRLAENEEFFSDASNGHYERAVRPALHLNLSLASQNTTEPEVEPQPPAFIPLDQRVSTSPSSTDGIYKVDKGSEVVDFHITSPKGLEYLSNYSKENNNNAWNANWNYYLDVDLDMTGYTLNPLGYSTMSCIQGTFIGQGHTIKNAKDLFGNAQNFIVKNLRLYDCGIFITNSMGDVTVSSIILTGRCSLFEDVAGSLTVTGMQFYPSAAVACLIADTVSTAKITINGFLAIVPDTYCFFFTVSNSLTLNINIASIHDLGNENVGFIYKNSSSSNNITIISQTNFYFRGNVSFNTTLRPKDSSIISAGMLILQTTAVENSLGFYIADKTGIKVFNRGFTDQLWCQQNGMVYFNLPQLRYFLAGGNVLPSFNMRSWASNKPTA